MSFAQFLTLLVAACLVLATPMASLVGLVFAAEEIARLSAAVFAIAVVVRRRGVDQWLPVAGWLVLGALLANLVLPALGVSPAYERMTPALAWTELGWRLVFVLLLLRGQPGWGDGALLALCVATSDAGSLALVLGMPFQAVAADAAAHVSLVDVMAAMAAVVAGLMALLGAGLALGWAAGWPLPRRWRLLAWLGVLASLVQGLGLLRQ